MRITRRRLRARNALRTRPARPAPEPELRLEIVSEPVRPQDSTDSFLPALAPEVSDGELLIEPEPPAKLEFACPCGARLIAVRELYDKHTRCALCQAVLLISLVYDGEKRAHEIVPFRVNPEA